MQPQRDLYIDFLRFIGISLIILAHVEAPSGITQFRSFDVPLMVFVSGLSFSTKGGGFWKYVWKRVKRLCIPVYLFLTILFTAVIGAGIVGLKNPWGWDQIAGTYLLLNEPSIDYVWIIRVFLMMSIIAPPLYPLVAKMNMHKFILVLFLILGIQGLLVKSSNYIHIPALATFYREYFLYVIGYSIPLMLGLRLKNATSQELRVTVYYAIFALIAGILVYELQTTGPIVISPFYKYPPHGYFILYGACVSVILWAGKPLLQNIIMPGKTVISFIGANTMWIYLWHIPAIIVINRLLHPDYLWFARWVVMYAVAAGIYWIQYTSVNYLSRKYPNRTCWNYLK